MGWIVRLVETGLAGRCRSADVMEIDRSGDLGEIGNLGLSLAEGKRLLECVQPEMSRRRPASMPVAARAAGLARPDAR